MLTINSSDYCPDSTYFTTGSVEPRLNDTGDTLTIYNGNGSRRSSWGAPGVTSTVVVQDADLASVHVGYHHKHHGGQFWRHYRAADGLWQQVAWAQLSDPERQRILDGYQQNAPRWANIPGKLRTEYQKPTLTTRTTYKIVRLLDNGRMVSLYDGKTEYTLGKRLTERAIDGHNGGYYSYPTEAGVKRLFDAGALVPDYCYEDGMRAALIECEISGTIISYDGKLASTYLKPVRVVETLTYAEKEAVAC